MAALVTALETEFTPAAGTFVVHVTGTGEATLQSKGVAGGDWAPVGPPLRSIRANVDNPVAGVVYRFTSQAPGVLVRADE